MTNRPRGRDAIAHVSGGMNACVKRLFCLGAFGERFAETESGFDLVGGCDVPNERLDTGGLEMVKPPNGVCGAPVSYTHLTLPTRNCV